MTENETLAALERKIFSLRDAEDTALDERDAAQARWQAAHKRTAAAIEAWEERTGEMWNP